jgi:hypothetical protein
MAPAPPVTQHPARCQWMPAAAPRPRPPPLLHLRPAGRKRTAHSQPACCRRRRPGAAAAGEMGCRRRHHCCCGPPSLHLERWAAEVRRGYFARHQSVQMKRCSCTSALLLRWRKPDQGCAVPMCNPGPPTAPTAQSWALPRGPLCPGRLAWAARGPRMAAGAVCQPPQGRQRQSRRTPAQRPQGRICGTSSSITWPTCASGTMPMHIESLQHRVEVMHGGRSMSVPQRRLAQGVSQESQEAGVEVVAIYTLISTISTQAHCAAYSHHVPHVNNGDALQSVANVN